jgi:hypothetical protein
MDCRWPVVGNVGWVTTITRFKTHLLDRPSETDAFVLSLALSVTLESRSYVVRSQFARSPKLVAEFRIPSLARGQSFEVKIDQFSEDTQGPFCFVRFDV